MMLGCNHSIQHVDIFAEGCERVSEMAGRWHWVLLGIVAVVITAAMLRPGPWQQQPAVIGILHPDATNLALVDGFLEGLKAAGFEDGQAVRIIHDGPSGSGNGVFRMLRMILDEQPDLILAASTPAAKAAASQIRSGGTSLLFAAVSDPITAGLVPSLEAPTMNVTGIRLVPADDERLDWLKKIAPGVRRVLLPHNPNDPSSLESLDRLTGRANELGLDLQFVPVVNEASITSLIQAPPETDAIFLPRDRLVESYVQSFADLAIARKWPLAVPSWTELRSGALFSYGFLHNEAGRHAADMAVRFIKQGTWEGMPVQTAENVLALNLQTAEAIGLSVPKAIQDQAKWLLEK